MASSSNSKRPFCSSSSSSSNSKWRYDVFLSFRGEDTRKNFTSHLHKALDHANIETFIDDEGLRKGEEISPKLLKAIEGSRIALIVFSKTYAHSKWCLDELVKIMKCQEENGQEVFPIFYDVEPSEVRNQTGIYGEEFKSHESNANEEKKKKIEEWRTALRKAGNLSGFHLKDDRSEAEFIEDIIGEIRRLIPKLVHVGENMVGMDENLKVVKSLIDGQSNEVSMVGIYGIGGIGKTTIAKVVYNDMLDQFKCHSFLENVREKSEDKDGLLQLQKELLCDILMEKNLVLRNIDEGFKKIKSECCSEKVLIVLDDVDCLRQLEFLAPNSECFHRGSIIIVTTRNKRCLDVYKSYSSYEAKGLAHEQAKELFCWKAFKQDHPIENYEDLSNHILDYAKGLPLALVVLGSFLSKRNEGFWKSTLNQLKTNPPEDIQRVLQISYDGLDDKCKKLFLDIACFFKDEDEEIVTRILEGCKFHPTTGLTVLHERCLISITYGTIRMHDLLQEMGWEIVRKIDPECPGKWSRLWELQDIESVFAQNKGTENIEGIFINQSHDTGKRMQLTAEAFKKMNRLRLLKVTSNSTVQLSQDFELPCHDLVYFHWRGYPLESLPSNFHAYNLVELNLKFSNIKHLWEGNMSAKKLKVIDLSYSRHLIDISSISSMQNLETLILKGCKSLESLPRNLHKLKCLQTLSCDGCSNLESFPKIKEEMRSLRKLNLRGTGIMELPSSIRHLNGLEDLNLSRCENLSSLPDSIYSLSSLQILNLDECSNLVGFPNINLGSLKALEYLNLTCWYNLESLPNSIGGLSSLQTLVLKQCSKLKGFPDINIGSLKALKYLDLSCCENLESLPNSIGGLSSLQTLVLKQCSKLKGFPDINIGSLKALEKLDLSSCYNLESLPNSIGGLSSLQTLLLIGCSKLKGFPDINIGSLKALKYLDLSCCENVESLLNSIGGLSSLQTLVLKQCSKLKGFPDINIGSLKALEKLDLSLCYNLESLPNSIGGLSSLRTLLLEWCSKLKGFPDINIGSLKALEKLDLSSCYNLESLPNSIGGLSSLQTLLLIGCSKLKGFPDINIGSLKALESLDFSYCRNLESLPNSIGGLSSLRTLLLEQCSKLKGFPDINIGSLKALESLDFSYCRNLESLPVGIYNLSSLKSLKVTNCPKLKEMLEMQLGIDPCPWLCSSVTCHISNSKIIWDDGFSSLEALNPQCLLSSLVDLYVRKFYGMEKDILSGSFHLSSLQILSLENCPSMAEGILDKIFHLSSLVELSLTKCKLKEEGIPSDIRNLSPLQQLSLRDCNLMEGKILNHICHLTSLEKLYLGWNHFSSIPAGIRRLSNLKALDLSHCKNLQQIPELPSSLRFLDAHCSDGISSSPSLLPIIHSMVNCFKSEIEDSDDSDDDDSDDSDDDDSDDDDSDDHHEVLNRYSFFWGNGIVIVIPRSSGILEWITNRNMGKNEVTIELPPNWYENDDLWGFALCCVYVESGCESEYESGHISEDSEPGVKEPRFSCGLIIEGNNQSQDVGAFFLDSHCFKYDVSVMQWVICYPKLAIEESYHTNQWTHFKATFYGAQVEECGIRLVYREDYEQKHPIMAQGSTSHGNFGEHGSVREDTNSKAHNKRNPTEQSPGDESHHKRFRETQD